MLFRSRLTSVLLKMGGVSLADAENRFAKKTGELILKAAEGNQYLVNRFQHLSIEVKELDQYIQEKKDDLAELSVEELRQKLLDLIIKLAKVGDEERNDPKIISEKALAIAARQVKLNPKEVAPEELERLFFEHYLDDQVQKLKKALEKGGPELEQKLEEKLSTLLQDMGRGEQQAIREAMGLEELNAKAMLAIFKSGSMTAATLGLMNAAGFGLLDRKSVV